MASVGARKTGTVRSEDREQFRERRLALAQHGEIDRRRGQSHFRGDRVNCQGSASRTKIGTVPFRGDRVNCRGSARRATKIGTVPSRWWPAQKPGVVAGDFRPAQQHLQFRPPLFQSSGDPQRSLDIPEIAGKAHHPRPPCEDLLHQPLIAARIVQRRRQQLDLAIPFEALPAGVKFQIRRRQGHIAFHRARSGCRNRQLHQQHQAVIVHVTQNGKGESPRRRGGNERQGEKREGSGTLQRGSHPSPFTP